MGYLPVITDDGKIELPLTPAQERQNALRKAFMMLPGDKRQEVHLRLQAGRTLRQAMGDCGVSVGIHRSVRPSWSRFQAGMKGRRRE